MQGLEARSIEGGCGCGVGGRVDKWIGQNSDFQGQNRLKISSVTMVFKKNFFCVFIYFLRERKRETGASRGGAERGRHKIQSRLQALSCQGRTRHGAQAREPGDHDLSWSQTLNWLSHPGIPSDCVFNATNENVILEILPLPLLFYLSFFLHVSLCGLWHPLSLSSFSWLSPVTDHNPNIGLTWVFIKF